ncbi:hypothetical protein GCM10017771_54850 [Streptomyces capitiformicae]|uniref:Uncharacterized protein n=1 Tax=Streptomyces capitiformicae TaxID=2014920 RepID=A0A918Z456_9ACTN|nr:hypothetical protein GCM10017771_54850 [Streptomyces capitiformicae]
MDDVGPVFDDRRGDSAAGQGDADLGVARERKGGHADDGARRLKIGCGSDAGGGGRGHDERGVTACDKVPRGLQGAVGHAVHIGGKGLGHYDDTHTGVVVVLDVAASTWIFPGGERPMSVALHTCPGQPASMPS